MKHIYRLLLLFLALVSLQSCSERTDDAQTKRIAAYCKVWGFLKYYHPAVAAHDLDWDSAFIEFYPKIKSATTQTECDKVLLALYQKAENAGKRTSFIFDKPDSNFDKSYANADFTWLDDRSLIGDEAGRVLRKVRDGFRPQYNHYILKAGAGNPDISIDNEFSESDYPTEPIRVLALARYWNIINYFYPYKDVIGSPWDSTLHTYIPRMIEAKDTLEYQLGVLEFAHRINDGHSFVNSEILRDYFGRGSLPIGVADIDGKVVVCGCNKWLAENPDSLLKTIGLHKGDLIEKINGKPVAEVQKELLKHMSGSNERSLRRNANFYLFSGTPKAKIVLTVTHGTETHDVNATIQSDENYIPNPKPDPAGVWKILDGNIGYIDMGELKLGNADSAMMALLDTKCIVFDIRDYPQGTMFKIASYLTTPRSFCTAAYVNLQRPGYLYKAADTVDVKFTSLKYKGEIVLLVDETTQSHAEYTTMLLHSVPGAKTFGSQTAGADGNISMISLPGKITAYFSGIGIFYPDGTPTQRVGIKIDYEVKPTIKGIREGRDEVLERAIRYINTGS